MLRKIAVPKMQIMPNFNPFIFQQDGAPSHNAIFVYEFLDAMFPEKWIGRYETIEWPRSADSMSLDLFSLGVLKEKVFQRKPDILFQLCEFITEACQDIDSNLKVLDLCNVVAWRTDFNSASKFREDILSIYFISIVKTYQKSSYRYASFVLKYSLGKYTKEKWGNKTKIIDLN